MPFFIYSLFWGKIKLALNWLLRRSNGVVSSILSITLKKQ